MSQKPGLSGTGGTLVTVDLAEANALTWSLIATWVRSISRAAMRCSTASGPAPRWAAPAALPCQDDSIRAVSFMIESARSA